MKTIHAILAVACATLLIAAAGFAADETEIEKRIQIKIAADDEMIAIDADDMEVGETRQSFTESGKEVLITRTEGGFDLEVDGKEIDLGLGGEGHHSVFNMHGDQDAKVIIKKMHGGEGHGYSFIHTDKDHVEHHGEGGAHGEGHGEHVFVHKGDVGDDFVWVQQASAADHLIESGVLDDLDEEKRQEILDALKEIEPSQKKVIVEVHKEIHEEHDDEQ